VNVADVIAPYLFYGQRCVDGAQQAIFLCEIPRDIVASSIFSDDQWPCVTRA